MNTVLDSELIGIHQELLAIYNGETSAVLSNACNVVLVKATNFLAHQATIFADAALMLMEDSRQPINPAVALLRTCLEAQAKANHIIGGDESEREKRAGSFQQLIDVGHEYYETLAIQMTKDFAPDSSNTRPQCNPYLPFIKNIADNTDTSKLSALKQQYTKLNAEWGYAKVVGRERLFDPSWQNRSEAQRLQPELYLRYVQACAFVHSDPSSLRHALLLTPLSLTYTIVMAEISAVLSFFVALGKERDKGLRELIQRFIDYPILEKILPSKDLPST